MKKLILFIVLIASFGTLSAQTHLKKDGTPDMRYRENKDYPTSYTPPPTYTPPPSTYTPPPSTYTPPPTNYDPYPTKKDGSPDMRYKSNREIYPSPR